MTSKKSAKKITAPTLAPPQNSTSPADNSAEPSFPIVGIGASAGGLAAFEAFFSGMPSGANIGMAFVLVQHLAPDHKSILTELIQRYTKMKVYEVEDGMVVQPDCVYIIPPNRDMALLNGALQLLEPIAPRGQRLPIDFFFRSLAQDRHEQAIGIVLSGTGSDGTQGVRAIKGEAGMVMVQSSASTEFDGMPRSVMATGLVDYELPPAEMASKLISYASHAYGHLPKTGNSNAAHSESALKKILILLRAQTGHDFSQYKPSTINRRIERRMAVHQIDTINNYAQFIQHTPQEVNALFDDLLIGVTNFFRDPQAFKVLEEEVIPKLFEGKPAGSTVRVWSTGCSTGEEAYSIAILLQERMELLKQSYQLQVFATDIDRRAIAKARTGLYPASIAADVTPERLARFFTADADGSNYRINKNIRDLLVFSEHNLIKDPTFSKLDLISCRNLLIYLGAELQKKLIPLFHYALKPDGILFLGTSEGIGEFGELFRVLDRQAKLYQRKQDIQGSQRSTMGKFYPSTLLQDLTLSPSYAMATIPKKKSLRELTEQTLLQQLSISAALINAQGDILYLHGHTGRYLEMPAGEAGVINMLKMAREGLRPALVNSLNKTASSRVTAHESNLRVKTNGHYTLINLSISPVRSEPASAPLFLVMLEEVPASEAAATPAERGTATTDTNTSSDADARIAALLQELRSKEEYLKNTHEELETSTEELKSSNEEMQSVNEELQSTNEELETSKEELQSVNEELATVNAELQTKVLDLTQANNDMNNLLAGTGIGTLFVDHQLRILRFTPATSKIINLISSDVGRPVAHIVSNLVAYNTLVEDVQAVLDTLIPHESSVQSRDGKWYTMRIQPYRTLENVIEGAVISFVDITEMILSKEKLRKANDLLRLAVVVRDAHDAITVQDLEGKILAWNPGATMMYGWSEAEALQMNVRDRIPANLREGALAQLVQLGQNEILQPSITQRLNKDGATLTVSVISTALLNENGLVYAVATTERAIHGDVS